MFRVTNSGMHILLAQGRYVYGYRLSLVIQMQYPEIVKVLTVCSNSNCNTYMSSWCGICLQVNVSMHYYIGFRLFQCLAIYSVSLSSQLWSECPRETCETKDEYWYTLQQPCSETLWNSGL